MSCLDCITEAFKPHCNHVLGMAVTKQLDVYCACHVNDGVAHIVSDEHRMTAGELGGAQKLAFRKAAKVPAAIQSGDGGQHSPQCHGKSEQEAAAE